MKKFRWPEAAAAFAIYKKNDEQISVMTPVGSRYHMRQRHGLYFLIAGLMLLFSSPAAGDDAGRPLLRLEKRVEFERITVEQGLSHGTVTDLLQDRQGFMWFGTRNGLNRYNGYHITVFRHDPLDPHSLPGNDITVLFEDTQGVLWIGTNGQGLARFDSSMEQFHCYPPLSDDTGGGSGNIVRAIVEDHSGILWIGSNNGLARLDRTTGKLIRFTDAAEAAAGLGDTDIRDLCEDAAGYFWIGTYNGLDRIDSAAGRIVRHYGADADPEKGLSSNYIERLYEDEAGILWIGTRDGLNALDPSRERFSRYMTAPHDPSSLSHNTIRAIHEDAGGILWVGTDNGLNALDRKTGRFSRHHQDDTDPLSLSSNLIQAIAEDRAGALWLATYGDGVNRLDQEAKRFARYTGAQDPDGQGPILEINAIHEDPNGDIWLGTEGNGLHRIHHPSGAETQYRHDPKNPCTLGSDFITTIEQDRAGALWIGTYHGGLNRMDQVTGFCDRYLHDPQNPASLSDNNVWSVRVDRIGTLWVGTLNGLNRYDPVTDSFVRYRYSPGNPYALSSNDIRIIYADDGGSLWIGTRNGGLNLFNSSTSTFTRFRHNPNDPHSLLSDDVHSIFQDSAGRLWIGTTLGLDRMDPISGTFTHFRREDGLPNESIMGILEDDQRRLWISTEAGLSTFTPDTGTFINYDRRDGLQDNTFNPRSALRTQSGEMLFGGPGGLNLFRPDQIQKNNYIPPVVLTGLRIFQQPVTIGAKGSPLSKHIQKMDRLILYPHQSSFSFTFAALSFRTPDRNQFAYRLEGFNKEWIHTGSAYRTATYVNVPSGDYIFHVKASNNDGLWNETGKRIAVTVLPPWWRSPWFIALALVMTGVLVAAGFRWRLQGIENRNRHLEAVVAERTRELRSAMEAAEAASKAKNAFLANMSHELRTPLNGVLGYVQILKFDPALTEKQAEGLEIVHQSGEHLLMLINDILDLARIEAGKIEIIPEPLDLPVFLDGIVTFMRAKAEAKNLELRFEADSRIPRGVMADDTRLRQVMLNLLGNAIKFTDQGYVSLRVERPKPVPAGIGSDQAFLRFTVADTGMGIDPEHQSRIFKPFEQASSGNERVEGAGLGLAISRQIVTLMGGRIGVRSEAGGGSVFWFEVALPMAEVDLPQLSLPARQPLGYDGPRYKVLVVDDKAHNRQLLSDMLSALGFDVISAEGGREAVEKALAEQPHVVMMDLVMPGMGGLEAIRVLRQYPETVSVVIITVSASVLEADRKLSREAGSNAFLAKPVRHEELVAVLGQHLQLQWHYGTSQETSRTGKAMIPPPVEELAALNELARMGNMRRLRKRLSLLEQQETRFRPFVDHLKGLVRRYEIKQIQAFLNSLSVEEEN